MRIRTVLLRATMDSQTNQQVIMMLARKGNKTFVTPSGTHSGTLFKLRCPREQDVVLQMDMLVQVFLKLFQCLV